MVAEALFEAVSKAQLTNGATFYFSGTRVWVLDADDRLRELRGCCKKI
jgi:hypothetical protein